MHGLALTVLLCVACAPRAQPPPAPVQARDAENARPTVGASPREAPPPEAPLPEESRPEPSLSGAVVPATPEPPAEPLETGSAAVEVRQCTARGGTIQPVCMSGQLACVVRYRDGGKRCRDKRDCTGECLYEGPVPAPATAVGSCQRTNDPCGCKAPIQHGSVQSTLCVD
jgi:hypothetical protein